MRVKARFEGEAERQLKDLAEATHLLTRWFGTGAVQALLRDVAAGGIAVWQWDARKPSGWCL